MTTPNLPWDSTTEADLPQGAWMPGQLGDVMQDHTAGKYLQLGAGRFPGIFSTSTAGDPANILSPLGVVNDLVSKFVEHIANADPATITRPQDLEAFIVDFVEDLPVVGKFIDLGEALMGDYSGDDPVLLAMQDVFALFRKLLELVSGVTGGNLPTLAELADGFAGLAQAVGGFIEGLFKVPLWQLDSGGVEVVDRFDELPTVEAVEGWSWDDSDGHDADGCALFTATGAPGVLLSPTPVEVREGEPYQVSAWAKATGASGGGIALGVQWYDAEHTALSSSTADTEAAPSTSWAQLSGTVTVPAGARFSRRMLRVEATSGEVRWDDVRFKGEATTIPQAWVKDLASTLQGILDWLGSLVDQGLAALGLPTSGDLADKITELADGWGDLLDTAEDAHAQLSDLVGDLLTDPASVIGTLPQAAVTGLTGALGSLEDTTSQIADNINSAIAEGVAVGTGAVEQVFTTISDLLGLAALAQQIATTAQAQIQAITNDTEAPPELNGMSWSTTFGGTENTAISSGDWTATDIVIKGGHAGIADGAANNSTSWAVTKQQFVTDGQSASVVLGSPRGKSGFYECFTTLYLRANAALTEAAYCQARKDGGINVGKMTRSGATFTFSQLATVAVGVVEGDLVRFRAHGGNFYVVVNGITKLSWTDSGSVISAGAGFRYAGFSQQRKQFSDFFGSWTNDGYRVASFAMSDWLPPGVNVTTAAWRLRRGSGGEVALTVGHGAQSTMPSGFYNINDLAQSVTVTDLGTGQVTIAEDGWYEVAATSTNYDNSDADLYTNGTQATLPNAVRPSPWVLYVDGTAIIGPIMAGVSTTVYLAAGQVVRPGVSASWPFVASGKQNNLEAFMDISRSNITHVSGSPSASFTGRKVG